MLATLLATSAWAGEWFGEPLDYWRGNPYGQPMAAANTPVVDETTAAPEVQPRTAPSTSAAPAEPVPLDWSAYSDPRTAEFWRDGDHVPPAPLLELIREPSPENVARYRAWTKKQLEVAGFVSHLLAEAEAPPPVSWVGVQVVYFYASSCGYCQKNAPDVLALMRLGADVMPVHLDRPSVVYPRSTPWTAEMGTIVAVQGTPTWVLSAEGRRRVVRGYATVDRLETELRALLAGEER